MKGCQTIPEEPCSCTLLSSCNCSWTSSMFSITSIGTKVICCSFSLKLFYLFVSFSTQLYLSVFIFIICFSFPTPLSCLCLTFYALDCSGNQSQRQIHGIRQNPGLLFYGNVATFTLSSFILPSSFMRMNSSFITIILSSFKRVKSYLFYLFCLNRYFKVTFILFTS